jgi:hypothetical protein|tara:strand:- start:6236 stop:6481 length:246 start_codon:yes stop_codon:yes gene_type:complete
MSVDNIPVHIRRIIQDRELSMAQKMVAFMAFMPSLPADPKNDQVWEDNMKVGETIKKMIDEGKLSLNGFDERARLRIVQEP